MQRLSERKIIEIINSQCSTGCANEAYGFLGTGDDCAVIEIGQDAAQGRLAITTDTLVEDVHFSMRYFSPWNVGRKLAAVNLSDIAAQGALPRWAFLNLALPEKWRKKREDFILPFSQGLCSRLSEFDTILAGGDTVSCPDRIVLTLTVIGRLGTKSALSRSGAKKGDIIYCSGYLGESAAGLMLLSSSKRLISKRKIAGRRAFLRLSNRHLDPVPRIELGRLLLERGLATAAMDMSDGLATDLAHLCDMSGTGAEIHAHSIPISRTLKVACRKIGLGPTPLRIALAGGEDFELLWTVRPERQVEMEQAARRISGVTPFPIGRITDGRGVWLVGNRGKEEISYRGYEH